ncbi:hypothetical protein [Actinoplanes sp. G11-F43]|uniref:hypothetical protein n=1 Tax=Actinoplanes sp. G11-F43 TaxID=3424130 RepID=UPI003D32FA24
MSLDFIFSESGWGLGHIIGTYFVPALLVSVAFYGVADVIRRRRVRKEKKIG